MKLLTHNFLTCKIKGVQNGYPFKIVADKVETVTTDFDSDFLKRIFDRVNYQVLKEAAESLGESEGLPEQATLEALEDEAFQKAYHHALLEVVVKEGALVCPETGRRFIVKKGIPNLLLNEDEIA
eukprot:jgi/Botrbrau1/18850/Bobra.177_2s0012.1